MKVIDNTKSYLIENYKLLVYIACTVGLVWIDVWRSIGTGAQWALAINCTGICVFLMTISRIDLKDFLKIPYIIWSVFCTAGAYPAYMHFKPGTDYDASVAMAIINVWLFGLIAIWLIFHISYIGKSLKERSVSPAFFVVWFLFMALAIVSVNEAHWPLWFLIMMGGFYLFPIDKKGLEEMMLGITDGILVAFFWIQSRAFLYRPYDGDRRYMGHFNNVNVNAMFFLVVYIAWLARLGYVRRKEKVNKLECLICFVFAGSMWDFTLLTLSRSTLLTFVLITIVYLMVEEIITFKNGIKGFFIKGVLLFLVFVSMFLPVYACCRYIPALRHHPIWYGDYSEERVHSWDPIDSEKYTSLKEFYEGMIGKTVRTIKEVDEDFAEGTKAEEHIDIRPLPDIPLEVEVISKDSVGFVTEYSDGVKPGSDAQHPLMTEYSANHMGQGFLGGRRYIYRYFISGLNFFGHKESFPEVYLSGYEYYGHTHNSFLQIAFCFGVPAGLLFIIMVVGSQIGTIINAFKKKRGLQWAELLPLLLLSIFAIDGLFEMTALLGKFMFIGVFISIIIMIRPVKEC